MTENTFDWSKYPLHESTRSAAKKCKEMIHIHQSILCTLCSDTPSNIEKINKHLEIIRINQTKLVLLGSVK